MLPCLFLQVGELLLRQYIFIHLSRNGDKFHLLLAMVHKLYAMVMRQCADDNPDALIHHEVCRNIMLLALLPDVLQTSCMSAITVQCLHTHTQIVCVLPWENIERFQNVVTLTINTSNAMTIRGAVFMHPSLHTLRLWPFGSSWCAVVILPLPVTADMD